MAHSLQRKIVLYGFIAGVLGMAAFHEGTLHIMHHHAAKIPGALELFGNFPTAYNLSRTGPFGMPWLAFLLIQGGLWGIVIGALLRDAPNTSPSTQLLARMVLLNGALGFGTVFFLRPFAVRG
jgi:hypothetical protein